MDNSADQIANFHAKKIVWGAMANHVTLVTGASGFLGRAVMKLLGEQKQHVIGLDPRSSATTKIVDDLSNAEKLKTLLAAEKITHIIHAGGVSGPMVMANDPVKVITINVLGSLNLLYAAMDAGVGTFIYCSSAAALGSFYESEPVDESYPLRPNSTYSASKAAVEMVLRGLWGKTPLDLCSLRFTVIYGPGRETTYTVEEIVGAALAGKVARTAPMADWPYIYIDDAARAAVQACYAKGRKQLSYFIAHPEKVTLRILPQRQRPPASPCASRLMPASRRPNAGRSISSRPHATSSFARKSVIAREFAA